MKIKRKIIYLGILLIIWSCQDNTEDQTILPEITLTKNTVKSVAFEDLVSIDSIKVMNSTGYLAFGSIQKIFKIGDKLLLDTNMPKTLTLLSSNLSVIKQLVPEYDNPNTLSQITSVCVFENLIYVLNRDKFFVTVLNDNFEIIEKIKIPVFCQSFQVLDHNRLALYTGNEPTKNNKGKFVIYDYLENEIITDLIPISNVQRKYFNFSTSYHFDKSSKQVLFWDSSINTIFEVTKDGIIDLYHLDYGKKGVPKNFYEETSFENPYDFVSQMRNTDYAFRHFRMMSNSNKILVTYEQKDDFYHCLYDISSGETTTFNSLTSSNLSNTVLAKNEMTFFVSFYEKDKAICFLPYEFAESQPEDIVQNVPAYNQAITQKENILIFCSLK